MPRIRQEAFAVSVKFHVQALAANAIESHSQSSHTLPVATFQEGYTSILDVQDTHASVIVNFLELTGTHEPKSISTSVTVATSRKV